MRARYPDTEGFVERDGVKVGYEVFGSGEPTLVFAPTDPLVHSRAWKAQVPYLARTSRVVTIDPRGNGRSDRPESSAAYADTEFVADTIAVMDATGVRPRGPRRDMQQRVDDAPGRGPAPGPGARHRERRRPGCPSSRLRCPGARSTTSTPMRPGPTKAGPGNRFSGYVSGFDPDTFAVRDAIRAELGYRPGEQVCLVTVGAPASARTCSAARSRRTRRLRPWCPDCGWSW